MGVLNQMKIFLHSFCVSLLLILGLFFGGSCSNVEPSISGITSTVVFDYESMDKTPQVRLSLFVEASDLQRMEKLTALNEETGYQWTISQPRKFSGKNNRTYAGYTNLVAPKNEFIPQGRYSITYTDAQEKICSTYTFVSYDNEFYKAKGSKFPLNIRGSYSEKIALYNKDGNLIYFGNLKPDWSDSKIIVRDQTDATVKRICYTMNNNAVCVMMPKEDLPASDL